MLVPNINTSWFQFLPVPLDASSLVTLVSLERLENVDVFVGQFGELKTSECEFFPFAQELLVRDPDGGLYFFSICQAFPNGTIRLSYSFSVLNPGLSGPDDQISVARVRGDTVDDLAVMSHNNTSSLRFYQVVSDTFFSELVPIFIDQMSLNSCLPHRSESAELSFDPSQASMLRNDDHAQMNCPTMSPRISFLSQSFRQFGLPSKPSVMWGRLFDATKRCMSDSSLQSKSHVWFRSLTRDDLLIWDPFMGVIRALIAVNAAETNLLGRHSHTSIQVWSLQASYRWIFSQPAVQTILNYDFDHDGVVTRREFGAFPLSQVRSMAGASPFVPDIWVLACHSYALFYQDFNILYKILTTFSN